MVCPELVLKIIKIYHRKAMEKFIWPVLDIWFRIRSFPKLYSNINYISVEHKGSPEQPAQ